MNKLKERTLDIADVLKDWDAILDQVHDTDTAVVVTEQGQQKVVLLPAAWLDSVNQAMEKEDKAQS